MAPHSPRRNFQSPAAVPWTNGVLGTSGIRPCRTATLAARPRPVLAPDPTPAWRRAPGGACPSMTARFRACRAQLCASGHGAPAAVPWTIGVLGTPVPHCDPCSPAVPPKRQKRRAGRRHQAKGALVPRLFRPRHQLGGADTNWDGGKPITDNHRWTQGDDQVKAGLHSAIPLYPPPPHFHADTHARDKREGINL